jgi:hypothetical protein
MRVVETLFEIAGSISKLERTSLPGPIPTRTLGKSLVHKVYGWLTRYATAWGTPAPAASTKPRVLVFCTHLRPGRHKQRWRYFLQPITGLHIASLIDQRRYDVRLYHEDWHGPFDTSTAAKYDLVFLTGLQPDFDRMRQLSYFFRRAGTTVVAGGSICTLFPEFAAQFFDAVCIGGVDSVPAVIVDFERGAVQTYYRSPARRISRYTRSRAFGEERHQSDRPSDRGIARLQLSMQLLHHPSGNRGAYELRTFDTVGDYRARHCIKPAVQPAPLVSNDRVPGQQLFG